MKDVPRFIDTHREFERIAVVNVSNHNISKNCLALANLTIRTRGAREWDFD